MHGSASTGHSTVFTHISISSLYSNTDGAASSSVLLVASVPSFLPSDVSPNLGLGVPITLSEPSSSSSYDVACAFSSSLQKGVAERAMVRYRILLRVKWRGSLDPVPTPFCSHLFEIDPKIGEKIGRSGCSEGKF